MNLPITSSHFPYLPARVSVHQTTHKIEALIDTGFSGYIIMPPGLVTNGKPRYPGSWSKSHPRTLKFFIITSRNPRSFRAGMNA